MSRTPKILLGLMLAAVAVSQPARADETNASTASSDQSWIQKHGKASYLIWMTGMHTEALSGNRDGTGTALEFDHYVALGADIGKGYSLKVTNWAAQSIDEDDSTRQFEPGDPYMTLSQGKILHSDRYAANLEGYLRYYFPFSRSTVDNLNKGTTKDYGHGMLRLYLNPSKSWFDGKLTFNLGLITNFRFNSMTPQERFNRATAQSIKDGGKTTPQSFREDMYFILDPILDYSVNPKVDVYLEWASGYLRHTTNGHWTSITPDSAGAAKADGMYISPGVYWSPTKKVYVNPYLSYQLSNRLYDKKLNLFHADVGLQLQYTFM